jgi:RNA polymerase sigma factor (sigma-70 family)
MPTLNRFQCGIVETQICSDSNSEDWASVVAKIQAGQADGMERLYKALSSYVGYLLGRKLGTRDIDDKVHDVFLVVVQTIRQGNLRQPECLMGFVRTVAHVTAADHIRTLAQNRRREAKMPERMTFADTHNNPEVLALVRQKAELVQTALAQLSMRDREILERFYLQEQRPDQICSEMNLSKTQFRVGKSRAKARFGEIGQKHSTATSAARGAAA